jgi:polar amino acid transport system permease protein
MNWAQVWSLDNLRRLFVGELWDGQPGGLLLTVILGVLVIALSTPLGTAIGLLREHRLRLLRIPAAAYVHILRNIPTIVLVFWAYFAPPYLGFEVSRFTSVAIALTLGASAYIAENVRGGVRAVPRGHIEAARILGLSRWQILRLVILPQAFLTIVPALTGRYIVIFKNTSLAFLIGLTDLTEVGREINTRLLVAPLEVYLTLLVLYFALNRCVSTAMRKLEVPRNLNRFFFLPHRPA